MSNHVRKFDEVDTVRAMAELEMHSLHAMEDKLRRARETASAERKDRYLQELHNLVHARAWLLRLHTQDREAFDRRRERERGEPD